MSENNSWLPLLAFSGFRNYKTSFFVDRNGLNEILEKNKINFMVLVCEFV